MKCHTCGSSMTPVNTDLPFKLGDQRIVIIKNLPVLLCSSCGEYIIEDTIMEWIEKTLDRMSPDSELEIVRYAA